MFYCEDCQKKKMWPKSLHQSLGTCEVCGEPKLCNNVPSSELSLPKNEEEVLDALKVIGQLQAQGFKTTADSEDITVLENGSVRVVVRPMATDPKTGKRV